MKNLGPIIFTLAWFCCLFSYANAQSYSTGLPLPGLPKSVGPKPMSGSTSVTFASDQGGLFVTGTVTATNPSVGLNNTTAPTSSTLIGFRDSSGNLIPFPGSATSGITVTANQGTNPWVTSRTWSLSGLNDSVAVTGTVTANAGTGNFTVVQPTGTNLHTVVDSGSVSATQGTSPWLTSRNWNLASGSDSVSVTGLVTSTVSGDVTVVQPTGTNLHAVIDSGSISATQGTSPWLTSRNWLLSGATDSVGVTGTVTANAGTGNFNVTGTVIANQGNAPWSQNITQVNGSAVSLGQKASASSFPVVLPSDAPAITVTPTSNPAFTGRSSVNLIRNDYTVTAVSTAAYTQILASTSGAVNMLDVFDSSGLPLYFATGGVGVEVNKFIIYPGGNGQVPLAIPSGTRLSVKAVTATANTGELDINLFN